MWLSLGRGRYTVGGKKLIQRLQPKAAARSQSQDRAVVFFHRSLHHQLQAFLQRIINGGGRVDREYGLGRRRTDLCVVWSYPGGVQRGVIELKIRYASLEQTLAAGLEQTWRYADATGVEEAYLVIFDRRPKVAWSKKIWRRSAQHNGMAISVWGM